MPVDYVEHEATRLFWQLLEKLQLPTEDIFDGRAVAIYRSFENAMRPLRRVLRGMSDPVERGALTSATAALAIIETQPTSSSEANFNIAGGTAFAFMYNHGIELVPTVVVDMVSTTWYLSSGPDHLAEWFVLEAEKSGSAWTCSFPSHHERWACPCGVALTPV